MQIPERLRRLCHSRRSPSSKLEVDRARGRTCKSGGNTEIGRANRGHVLALKLMTDSLKSGFLPHLRSGRDFVSFFGQQGFAQARESVGRNIMTLLLQCRSSKLYLAANNQWTKDMKSAFKFESSRSPLQGRRKNYIFQTPKLSIDSATPLSTLRHHVATGASQHRATVVSPVGSNCPCNSRACQTASYGVESRKAPEGDSRC